MHQVILSTMIRDGADRLEVVSEALADGEVAYSLEWGSPSGNVQMSLDLAARMALVRALGGDPAGMGGA